ncbi:MAG: hypothetical protein WCI87_04865 [Euryarchaeota archaeon]
MKDEILTQLVNAFILISGVSWAIFIGNFLILFLPLEIVASVLFVAVAATIVVIALALFDVQKQEKRYQHERRTVTFQL